MAASRLATIFSVLVRADSMSALSLSLPLPAPRGAAGGLRCSSVVSRDVVTVAEALLPPHPVEVGCSIKKCGLNEVVVTTPEELELVTALGCTGEDGSIREAVREGVEALLT